MTRDLFGLLTRMRVSKSPVDLEKAAGQQYLFVLVGLVVGLIGTIASIVLLEFLGKNLALVSGGIVVVVLYYVTGILHTEGLADFADGVMASGTQERKREAMKDAHLGVAGVLATVLFLIIIFSVISFISTRASESVRSFPLPWSVPFAIGFVLSEMAGKLAMNTAMFLGPSSHAGMGKLFVRNASRKKLVAAILLASAISFIFTGWLFVLILLGLVAGYGVTRMARKNFGGVSGDAFGTANEVGRLLSLLAWVIVV